MTDDCPAPSPSASSHSVGQFPISSCWQCWDDGDRDQPPGYLMALGVLVACCVHGPAFWARNRTPGVIYTPPSRWLAGCLNLAVWQGCAAGNTGEPGRGWLGGRYFMAVSVTAQSGTGTWTQCQPGLPGPGAVLQGLLLSPVLSHGHTPGPLCHPVLCHLWILRAVDLGGEGREGGREGWIWMLGFRFLKGARLGQCCTPHPYSGGHNPWLWVQGRDGTSCMERGFGMEHLGPVSSSAMCPVGQQTGPSAVQGPEVSQARVQLTQ